MKGIKKTMKRKDETAKKIFENEANKNKRKNVFLSTIIVNVSKKVIVDINNDKIRNKIQLIEEKKVIQKNYFGVEGKRFQVTAS
jgi:hypothetical protein